jgi:hypothetical protein
MPRWRSFPRARPWPSSLHEMASPFGSKVIIEVMVPILKVVPKLYELCGESSLVLLMDMAH